MTSGKALLCLAILLTVASALKISSITRNTYLDKNIVRHVDLYNIQEKDLTNFEIAVDSPDTFAYVEASLISRDEEEETRSKLVISEIRRETSGSQRFVIFDVKLPKLSGNQLKVEVTSYYTHRYNPLPEKIQQSGQQKLEYFGNHYVSSPYVVQTQTTIVNAAKIEDATPLTPFQKNSNSVNFGPYTNISPFSYSSMRVHVTNNSPLLTVPRLVKDVEVSHWGNIAVEEALVIRHDGAELKTTFSRIEYMHGATGNSAKEFTQILPKGATDVYYRDIIGNISSSHVNTRDDGYVTFQIEPRFVMFGGWKIDFKTGYNLPISQYLTTDGSTYTLTIPLFNTFEDVVVDELEYRFTLPEGAENIKVQSSTSISKKTEEKKLTYLDVTGRPVVSFVAKNIISEHKDGVVVVTYTFSSSEVYKEPLLLVAGYFIFFLSCIFYFRFNLSL